MIVSVSIIIPTLNEEKYLPKLLESIKNQTVQPQEVIVSDSDSKDKTVEIAKKFKCNIVEEKSLEGSPAKGRNMGAGAATQKLLLFLDSDVVLPANFLEAALKEIEEKKLDAASCFIIPSSQKIIYRIGSALVNYFFLLASVFSPHAGGYCIFIKKELHEKIHGFDESLILGEDHDCVKRASKFGKFGYIRNTKIQLSMRRLEEDGLLTTMGKYSFSELQTLIFGKQKLKSLGIEFGKHHKV
jgi:glycosyltransferase involved in cell wall biosynthesis